jgi:hypothetical protein
MLTGLIVIAPLAACRDSSLPVTGTSSNVAATASTNVAAPPAVGPACYDTVSRLDVLQEVDEDIARGETRFYYWKFEGGGRYPYGLKNCGKPKVRPMRDEGVAGFALPPIGGRSGPNGFKCRSAIARFKMDYNQMLAKRFPQSLQMNCSGPATVDNSIYKSRTLRAESLHRRAYIDGGITPSPITLDHGPVCVST